MTETLSDIIERIVETGVFIYYSAMSFELHDGSLNFLLILQFSLKFQRQHHQFNVHVLPRLIVVVVVVVEFTLLTSILSGITWTVA